jgi:hypothetical protein
MLPTFFVIGAPKCGTTSLHFYLDQHPEIAMSSEKEPFVFVDPDWRSRLARYGSLFTSWARVRGESSTVYSQHPHYPGVPERIAEVAPEARFVYVVGEPIERALAHYRQHVVDGKEKRPPTEALADFEDEASTYVCASRYATQLKRYLARFAPERILVLEQSDLLECRARTMARVFEFLEVDPEFSSAALQRRLNRAEDLRTATAVGRRLRGSRTAAVARRLPLPRAVRDPLRRLLSRPVGAEGLDPELRARIAAALGDEVAWLREFTGRTFADWSL